MKVNLKNKNGVIIQRPVGFSWTTFFFGWWPALIRGDIKWFLIILGTGIVVSLIPIPGLPVVMWIFPFFYNKCHLRELINKGYEAATELDRSILIQKEIII